MHDRIRDIAGRHEATATHLAAVLGDMATIRDTAAAAGLTVTDTVITDPHDDSDPTHRTAYDCAHTAALDVHSHWADTVAALTDTWADEAWAASFIASTGLDYLKTDLKDRIGNLLGKADHLTATSIHSMQAVLDLPDGTPYEQVRRSVGSVQGILDDAATAARAADNLTGPATSLRRFAGPAGLVAGVGIDYYGGGESLEQAVVSNGTGLAASIAAGAATGALVGSVVPGLGTVAGAVGGTIGGIFASGVVDDIYENGMHSVGQSVRAGRSELIQATTAIVELGGVTVGGVVSWGRGVADAFS